VTVEEATRLLERPAASRPTTGLPTGSLALDSALGTRGWPLGRVSQVWGDPGTGKTTLLLTSVASAQREFLSCALVDFGGSFDPTYAAALGVDLDDLFVIRPSLALAPYDLALPVDFLVFDNVSGVSDLFLIPPGRTVLVFSQTRMTPCGAWTPLVENYAVGARLRRTHWNTQGDQEITATVIRDDYHPARGACASWWVTHGRGIDHGRELLTLGVQAGIVTRHGNHYRLDGVFLGNGWKNAAETLHWSRLRFRVEDRLLTLLKSPPKSL
jgi:hypothetical protein